MAPVEEHARARTTCLLLLERSKKVKIHAIKALQLIHHHVTVVKMKGLPLGPQGHPYFPLDAELPLWEPNTLSLTALLGGATAVFTVLVTSVFICARWSKSSLRSSEILLVIWFLLCESIV